MCFMEIYFRYTTVVFIVLGLLWIVPKALLMQYVKAKGKQPESKKRDALKSIRIEMAFSATQFFTVLIFTCLIMNRMYSEPHIVVRLELFKQAQLYIGLIIANLFIWWSVIKDTTEVVKLVGCCIRKSGSNVSGRGKSVGDKSGSRA